MRKIIRDWPRSFALFCCNRIAFAALFAFFSGGVLTTAISIWHNTLNFVSENPAMTMFLAITTPLVLIVLLFGTWGKKILADEARIAAEAECARLRAQLNTPQALVAAKSAQLRGMILDDAIAAKKGMAEKAKETERRRQEAAYAGLSPQLRKMVDELSARCLAELGKGT